MTGHSSIHDLKRDYMELRSIPAFLSIAFALASLYQFGGISEVHITWLDYTLSTQHAMFISLGVLVVAFMSSETKQFENYESFEKVLMAAGLGLIVGQQYVSTVSETIQNVGMYGEVLAFGIALAAWAVAVR